MKAVMAAVISILLLMGTPFAFAQSGGLLSEHSQANYQSGLKHGVIDGKDNCIDRCHWYVLEPGHGFAHLTWQFDFSQTGLLPKGHKKLSREVEIDEALFGGHGKGNKRGGMLKVTALYLEYIRELARSSHFLNLTENMRR